VEGVEARELGDLPELWGLSAALDLSQSVSRDTPEIGRYLFLGESKGGAALAEGQAATPALTAFTRATGSAPKIWAKV